MTLSQATVGVAWLCLGAVALGAQIQDPNHETTTPSVPGLTPATSLCKTSTEPGYATTAANPVRTGGGDLYMASRQVKYLSALRGSAGEGIHFKRGGSMQGPDGTILDTYRLDVQGGATITLYVDGYRWSDPLAPLGLLCGAAMNLAPPGPDAFETTRQQHAIAASLGAAEVQPISLDADGSKLHGIAYDHSRLIALAARAAMAAGTPFDANKLPRDVATPRLVILATPLTCGADTIAPESVVLTDARGNQPPQAGKATGDKIASLAAGIPIQPNAIAVSYAVPALIAGARVTVHYVQPCNGSQDVVLPVTSTPAHVVKEAPAQAPAGRTVPPEGARVVLQLFVAADGSAQYPAFVSGAFEFTDVAIESLKGWRFEPTRMNGAPLYQPEKVMVVVK